MNVRPRGGNSSWLKRQGDNTSMPKGKKIKRSKRAKNTLISHQSVKNATRKDSLMKLNHFIANGYVTASITILIDVFVYFVLTYTVNVFLSLWKDFNILDPLTNMKLDYGIHNMFRYVGTPWYYAVLGILLLIWDVKFVYQIQTAYRDLNKNQKASQRWTTLKEITSQYKAIPMRAETVTETFPGGGGVPICHYNGKIYIDDSPVNNLIVGITRSGKGEMFVFSIIDIYSRAEKKASLIIADPKLELASASYDTLVARGYEVHILNLTEELDSMGYNPLALIVKAYAEEDYATAEMLCSTFCFSIFNGEDSNNGDNQFFNDNATFLLSAMIMAHVEDCIALDKEENKHRKIEYDAGIRAFNSLSEDDQTDCLETFDKLDHLRNKLEKATLLEHREIVKVIRELEEQTEGFTDPRKPFTETHENQKKVNMYSIINTFQELNQLAIDEQGTKTMLDFYFNSRPDYDRAKLLFASVGSAGGQKTKGSIYSTMLSKLQAFTYEKMAKLTAESTLDLEDIGYGDKPIAIFMGTPDYDHSKDFLLSVFIRQTTFVLEKRASLSASGKCDREVIYLLDEFGNIPAIEGMDSLVTVCLGRNIRFDLIVQSYSQIEAVYGDKANTIIGNCGNQIYIQSADGSTTELFSGLVGSETITNINRIGDKMSLKKSFTEIMEERPLIDKNELQNLMQGECIIKRVMKRTDLKGRDVPPYPIDNRGELKFPYRFMYLYDYFPNGNELSRITKEHRYHISHTERTFDVKGYIQKMTTQEVTTLTAVERQRRWEFIKDIVLQSLVDHSNLADYEKEPSPVDSQSEIEAIKALNTSMVRYQWVSDNTIMFFNQNKNTFDMSKEQILECSPSEIKMYLQDKNPALSVGFYNIVTESFLLLTDPQTPNMGEIKPKQEQKGNNDSGESSGNSNMAFQDIEEKIAEYRKDNTKIEDLPDCRKITEIIFKQADRDILMENGIEDEFDLFDFSLKEVFQMGLLPPQQEKYIIIAIENAKQASLV